MEMDKEKKYHMRINMPLTDSLLATSRSARPSWKIDRVDLTSAMRASSFLRCRRRRRRLRFWFAVRPVSSSYWSSSELISISPLLSIADDDRSDASVSSAVKGSCSSHLGPGSPDRRLSSLRSGGAGCDDRVAPVRTELRRRWWLPADNPIFSLFSLFFVLFLGWRPRRGSERREWGRRDVFAP